MATNAKQIEKWAQKAGLTGVEVTTPGKGQGFEVWAVDSSGERRCVGEYPAIYIAKLFLPQHAEAFLKKFTNSQQPRSKNRYHTKRAWRRVSGEYRCVKQTGLALPECGTEEETQELEAVLFAAVPTLVGETKFLMDQVQMKHKFMGCWNHAYIGDHVELNLPEWSGRMTKEQAIDEIATLMKWLNVVRAYTLARLQNEVPAIEEQESAS